MRYIFLTILVVLLVCCRHDNKTQINSTEIGLQKTGYGDCLKEKDSLLINGFKKNVLEAIKSNDKRLICEYVNFPLLSGLDSLNVNDFLINDINIISSYFDKSMISSEEITHLKSEEIFFPIEENTNCNLFYIQRTFAALEFNVAFYLKKIEGQIKIVRIDFAG